MFDVCLHLFCFCRVCSIQELFPELRHSTGSNACGGRRLRPHERASERAVPRTKRAARPVPDRHAAQAREFAPLIIEENIIYIYVCVYWICLSYLCMYYACNTFTLLTMFVIRFLMKKKSYCVGNRQSSSFCMKRACILWFYQ